MREPTPALSPQTIQLIAIYRVEHDDVQVVAVNDPFIEPKYAVCEPIIP